MKNENESIIKRISKKLRSKKNHDFYSDYEEETTKKENGIKYYIFTRKK